MTVHAFTIAPTEAALTGRMRYRVICWRCAVVVHDSTTGPASTLQSHLEGSAPYERPLRPSDGVPADQPL